MAAEPSGSGEWRAETDALPEGWTALVRSRGQEVPPTGPISYRIFNVDPEKQIVYLSFSDFGRQPISDRMRPRYLAALTDVLEVLHEERSSKPVEELAQALSEVKGMLNRCLRKNQWDWLAVYESLGKPERRWLTRAVGEVGNLRSAWLANNEEASKKHLQNLLSLGAAERFERARSEIAEQTPHLPEARLLKGSKADAPQRLTSDYPAQESTPRQTLPAATYAKTQEAVNEHERTLGVLLGFLSERGYLVEEGRHVDAFCRLRSGPAIFEVKSLSKDNELSQMRHALSQLYEYRYRHSLEEAPLWVMFSREPHTEQ